MDHNPSQRPPRRDESYWTSLLHEVESLPPEAVAAAAEPAESKPAVPGRQAQDDAWVAAGRALTDESVYELTGIGCNKGGILVEWRGLAGFVPASQLVEFPNLHLEAERVRELQHRQHRQMRLRVIEVDAAKNRLIFSERAAQVAADERRGLWQEIAPGDTRSGTITNMAKFGAFVDLGGVEGLIHLSELSWSRISHPEEVVQAGQEVTTKVLEVDRENGRIALSLKRTRPDPWQGITSRYQSGQLVSGVVKSVAAYGVFVTLEEQLEGLIHVSELAEGDFLHPRNVVTRGDVVSVKVLSVDERGRKLALTLRGVQQRNDRPNSGWRNH